MKRRHLLVSVGVAVTAGCSSDSGGGTTPTSTSTPTTTATSTPTADEPYEDAIADLQEATNLIQDEITNVWDPSGNASFSTAGIDEAIENTNEHLDTAASRATGDTSTRVEETRAFVQYIGEFITVLESMEEGSDYISTASRYEQNGRWTDAVEQLEQAKSVFETATTKIETAQQTLSQIDENALGDVNYAQMTEATDRLAGIIDGYRLLMDAGIPLDEGFAEYTDASESYNNGNYEEAQSGYDAATERFFIAEERYRSAEEGVAQSLKPTFIRLTCSARTRKEASMDMSSAANAAVDGRYEEARSYLDEANGHLEEQCA